MITDMATSRLDHRDILGSQLPFRGLLPIFLTATLQEELYMTRIISLAICLLVCTAHFVPAFGAEPVKQMVSHGVAVEHVKAPSGNGYEIFAQGNFVFDFCIRRPSPSDKAIVLCVPAAFTRHDNHIDGVFVANGVMGNATAVNHDLGGALVITNGSCKLIDTSKGAKLTPQFLKEIQKNGSSLFQQFLLVHNGVPATFRDQSKFQRRAIGLTTQGTCKIFQSDKPISFSTFNGDLVAMGVTEALYFDMGAWDEGWYRHATTGKTITIGLDRSRTNRQSNWLVLKKP